MALALGIDTAGDWCKWSSWVPHTVMPIATCLAHDIAPSVVSASLQLFSEELGARRGTLDLLCLVVSCCPGTSGRGNSVRGVCGGH